MNKQEIKVKKGSRIFRLNAESLVEAIWQEYRLKLAKELQVIKAGNVNLHLIGKDHQRKKHIIRIYREDKQKESVDHELELVSFLCNKNFPTPKIYKTQTGSLYIKFKDYYISLFEFIEGGEPPYTPGVLYQIGQSLAYLHNLSKTERFKRNKILQKKNGFYEGGQRNRDIFQLLNENLAKLERESSPSVFEIAQTIKEKILALDFLDCKEGLVHDDAVHHNLIFSKDHRVYFLDWDDTGVGPFLLDFAIPIAYSCTLNAWNFKKINPKHTLYQVSVLPELVKAYIKGYDSKRKLEKLELERLKDACIFRIFDFQAWRFWHVIYKEEDKEKHLLNDWEIYKYLEDKFIRDVVPLVAKSK